MSSEAQLSHPSNTDLVSRRIPKLTYRNHIPEAETTTILDCKGISSPGDSSSQQGLRLTGAVDEIASFRARHASDAPSWEQTTTTRRRSSVGTTLVRSETLVSSDDVKRKKHNSVLGFLSLKEPSSSALDEFARQQQKQATVKGGRTTAFGMPGTSLQQLPSTVPKVNSKWDGLPSPVKDKPKQIRSPRRDSAHTVTSHYSASSSSSSSSSNASSRSAFGPEANFGIASKLSTSESISKRPKNSTQNQPACTDKLETAALDATLMPAKAEPTLENREPTTQFSIGKMQRPSSVTGFIGPESMVEPTSRQNKRGIDQGRSYPVATCNGKGSELAIHPSSESSEHSCTRSKMPGDLERLKSTGYAPRSNAQVRPAIVKADVLPWEVQDLPSSRPSTNTTVQRRDEKKKKMSFLKKFT